MHLLQEPMPSLLAGDPRLALKSSLIDRKAPFVLLYQTLTKLGHAVGRFAPGECDLNLVWTGKNVPESEKDRSIILEVGWIPRWSYQVSPSGSNFQGHYARQYGYTPLNSTQEQRTRQYLGKLRRLYEQSLNQDKVEQLRRMLKSPFVLFAFQLANDFNLKYSDTEFARFYSAEPDQNVALAQACIDKIEPDKSAPRMVYKQHPFDPTAGFRGRLKARGEILDNEADFSTHEIFATGLCQGAISINSNSLHEAAVWNIPCLCFGKLIWNRNTSAPPFPASLSALRDLVRWKPYDNPVTLAYLYYLLRNQWVLTDFQNGLMVEALLATKGLCEPCTLREQHGLHVDSPSLEPQIVRQPDPLVSGQTLPPALPAEPGDNRASNSGEKPFVSQLAQFFHANSVLKVGWESAKCVQCFSYTPEGDPLAAKCFETSTPKLPFNDNEFDSVFNFASLDVLDKASLADWLAELRRVTGQNLWIALQASPGRDRLWWETRLIEAGFRKHPLSQSIVPFEEIETEGFAITLQFQKVPRPALDRYPLEVLKAERDLHMDMLREPGIRSDAHLARYTLAREYLKPGMVVLDAACGLGYGSAMMATRTGISQIIGVDCSEWAVDYARANYAAVLQQLEFHAGDATRLPFLADACVDAVVSFETLEHLPNPDLLLREFARVLKPGGLFIGSVPNLWIDEKGHNPVPYHLHIYDHDQFQQQVAKYFGWQALYRQNAGGGWKRPQPRTLRLIENHRPATADLQDAEWWIGVAGKPQEQRPINHRQTDKGGRRQPEPGANQKRRVACIGDVCHASSP